MAETVNLAGWIAFFIGLYALAAGIGELRQPGLWRRMMEEMEQGSAVRFLTGFVVLFFGTVVYLATPWQPGDWLAVVVTVIGGLAILEGAIILALGDRYLHFTASLVRPQGRGWAVVSILIGVWLMIVGFVRL